MAIFHFSVQIIGRQAGRSAVAASAYRAADKLTNQYDGLTHDYSQKHWVTHAEILLPEHAPPEFRNREALWNAVEAIEKTSTAQLAREITIALPKELPPEAQIKLIKDFVQDMFVADGMCADIAWHNPPLMDDLHRPIDRNGLPTSAQDQMIFQNPHAHIMLTMRPIDAKGKWEPKSMIQYICKYGDKEKSFTAEEFKSAKLEGWQKQYRYYDDHQRKIWLTASEAEALGYKRINRTPKTAPMGKQNPTIARWNSKDTIKLWRKAWAEYANRELERYGIEDRIDHRSYKDQGRDLEIPQVHKGPAATNMERRAARLAKEGIPKRLISSSDIGNINKLIHEHNAAVRQILAEEERERIAIQDEKDSLEAKRKTLSSFRSQLIRLEYQRRVLMKKTNLLTSYIAQEKERFSRYTQEQRQTDLDLTNSEQELSTLKSELNSLGRLETSKKEALQKQISAMESKIHNLQKHQANLLTKYKFDSLADVKTVQETLQNREQESEKLQHSLKNISNTISNITSQYTDLYDTLSAEEKAETIEELVEEPIEPEIIYISTQESRLDNALFSGAIESVNQMLRLSMDTYRMTQTKVRRERKH